MAATSITPQRALRRPRRVDVRAVVGLFLLCVALGGSIVFWRGLEDARGLLVATRDLPAGAVLGADDVAVARVRADEALYAAAIGADERASLVGRQLAEPVHARQLLVHPQLAAEPRLGPGQMALAVPVGPTTAAGGRLRPGDAVRVLATREKGRPDARAEVVLARAVVYEVGRDAPAAVVGDAGRGAAPGQISWVSLIVSAADAERLAAARWGAELDVALLAPGA